MTTTAGGPSHMRLHCSRVMAVFQAPLKIFGNTPIFPKCVANAVHKLSALSHGASMSRTLRHTSQQSRFAQNFLTSISTWLLNFACPFACPPPLKNRQPVFPSVASLAKKALPFPTTSITTGVQEAVSAYLATYTTCARALQKFTCSLRSTRQKCVH